MNTRGKILGILGGALLLIFPAGISTDPIVTPGHTEFVSLDGYDPCLAGITGLARLRVMWFNDQVLVDTTRFGPNRFIYAVEHAAPDPRGYTLNKTGVVYSFKDPTHDFVWTTTEYQFLPLDRPQNLLEGTGESISQSGSGAGTSVGGRANASVGPFFVFVTEISPEPLQNDLSVPNPDGTGEYNFVTLVDTCRFHEDPSGIRHDTGTEPGHPFRATPHSHEIFEVDLYIGTTPKEGGITLPYYRIHERVGVGASPSEEHGIEQPGHSG